MKATSLLNNHLLAWTANIVRKKRYFGSQSQSSKPSCTQRTDNNTRVQLRWQGLLQRFELSQKYCKECHPVTPLNYKLCMKSEDIALMSSLFATFIHCGNTAILCWMYIISLTLSTNLTDDNPHDKFYAKKIFFYMWRWGGGGQVSV